MATPSPPAPISHRANAQSVSMVDLIFLFFALGCFVLKLLLLWPSPARWRNNRTRDGGGGGGGGGEEGGIEERKK